MLKRIAHIILSLWLAFIVLFGTTPKEFVHMFADHKDTIDHIDQHELSIDEQHHHCTFLGFELMPFANDIQIPFISFIPTEYHSQYDLFAENTVQRCIIHTSLRGPPTA